MNQEYKDVIIKNFVNLMKNCNVDLLKNIMIKRGVFSNNEINEIFKSEDARHNKRIFFFRLQGKTNGWVGLLEALKETNQSHIVDSLLRKGATVFNNPPPDEDPVEVANFPDFDEIPVNESTAPLDIRVKYSDKLYDTFEHNEYIEFYKSRSKNRGKVLIINNHKFYHKNHPYRNGAMVDDENLKKLFNQMGGWDLESHIDKTAAEMNMILRNFATYKNNVLYDICFIIIMSHGSQNNNDTIIYGVDENIVDNYISVAGIQKMFSNENCQSWRSKPKVMIFQVCRGVELQIPIMHKMKTETDSVFSQKVTHATNTPSYLSLRPEEDMLVGYSTLLGYKSHRDYYRGSWYIELLCRIFMNHAYNQPVNTLMMMIDQGLRRIMSEDKTMQTAEYRNRGFKRLYLNPGLYFEDDQIKKYYNN